MKPLQRFGDVLTIHVRRQRREELLQHLLSLGLSANEIKQYYVFLDRYLAPRRDEDLSAWHGRDKLYEMLKEGSEEGFLSWHKNRFDERMQAILKAGLLVKDDVFRELANMSELYTPSQRQYFSRFRKGRRRQYQIIQPSYEMWPLGEPERRDISNEKVPVLAWGPDVEKVRRFYEGSLTFDELSKSRLDVSFLSLQEVRDLLGEFFQVRRQMGMPKKEYSQSLVIECGGLLLEVGITTSMLRQYLEELSKELEAEHHEQISH